MITTKDFLVAPGSKVNLAKIDPDADGGLDKTQAKAQTQKNYERLSELQNMLYAEHKHSMLAVLQAIDGGGKDSTIRNVFGTMNPQGCRVQSFKQPTALELDHDFLWRIHQAVPAKGDVAVFNRSHYEDVLVVRVHNLVPEQVWTQHYDAINAFEKTLSGSGTTIVKFFLHISEEEQLARFKDRLDDPSKNWKVNEGDYEERAFWNDYQKAFQDMLSKCSTAHAPWFVIPADRKWFRDLVISTILVETFEQLNMAYPAPVGDIAKLRRTYFK